MRWKWTQLFLRSFFIILPWGTCLISTVCHISGSAKFAAGVPTKSLKIINIFNIIFVNLYQALSFFRIHYRDNIENNSRLVEVKAVIKASIHTMAIVYWCCTARHDEKCRKSWSTVTIVSSVRNPEYICPIRSISRSKHYFESKSKILWYGEIARKNWNGVANMLLRDLFSIQAIFDTLTEYLTFLSRLFF